MMKVSYHGGYCCGMTHISGFPHGLTTEHPEVKSLTAIRKQYEESYKFIKDPAARERYVQGCMNQVTGNGRYIHIERPKETVEARFRAYVKYIQTKVRTSGCIEVVLRDTQIPYWREVVEDAGFQEVNTFINSNTQHQIHVFHFLTGNSNAKFRKPIKEKEAKPELEVAF